MSQNNNNISELDFYTSILDYYQKPNQNREEIKIWVSQLIIKLMELLDNPINKNIVRNSLILLQSLFENHPPDIYNNRGVDVNQLSRSDKKLIISRLQKEFKLQL